MGNSGWFSGSVIGCTLVVRSPRLIFLEQRHLLSLYRYKYSLVTDSPRILSCQLQDAWPREAREDWGAGPGPHPLPRGLDGHEAGGHGQAIRLQEVLLVRVNILQKIQKKKLLKNIL